MKANSHVFEAVDATTTMTIRDYIAIQAMQAIIASPNLSNVDVTAVAKDAYRIADAMIKQSEVRDEQSI